MLISKIRSKLYRLASTLVWVNNKVSSQAIKNHTGEVEMTNDLTNEDNNQDYGAMCVLIEIEHYISSGQFQTLDDVKAVTMSTNLDKKLKANGFIQSS